MRFWSGGYYSIGKTPLRGQFRERISTHTNDPLYATALAIRPESGEVVFWLSLDIVSITLEIKEKITAELSKKFPGFDKSRLICNCIHTHTGPFLDDMKFKKNQGGDEKYKIPIPKDCMKPCEYLDYFVAHTVEACLKAYSQLELAGISPVLTYAAIGHCRRVRFRDGTSTIGKVSADYNFDCLESSNDNGIEMLYVYGKTDKLIGLVINICCPAQIYENQSFFSADFVGAFRIQLKQKLGIELPVITIIGAAGNVGPCDLLRRKVEEHEAVWELGRRLLHCFEDNLEKAAGNICRKVEFAHIFTNIPLPIMTVSKTEVNQANKDYDEIMSELESKEDLSPLVYNSKFCFAQQYLNRAKMQKKHTFYDAPVHVVRIGNCVFITNPFELYSEYGMRIVARSKAEHTFIAELTDDCASYLPTKAVIDAKGFSATTATCLVGSEGGELLTEMSIRMINDLFNG